MPRTSRHGPDHRAPSAHHARQAQSSDECRGLAVSMWDAHPQAFSLPAAAMGAGHVGRCPCLVDEDKPCQVEIGLSVKPVLALHQDVRAILFNGMARLFSASCRGA